MGQSKSSSGASITRLAPSRPWRKPEIRKLLAGAAESSGHSGNDGTTNLS
jgi:hypothetical protein